MNRHLTQLELYELALSDALDEAAMAHAASCAVCADRIAETRRLLADVAELDPTVSAPAGLDEVLARRLDDQTPPPRSSSSWWVCSGTRRWSMRAAAAVLLFASGVATHALWRTGDPAPTSVAAPNPPLAIQRAGTDYVAAIARLVDDSRALRPADVEIGREVALAAMTGAAFELRQLPGSEEMSTELYRILDRARTGTPQREETGP